MIFPMKCSCEIFCLKHKTLDFSFYKAKLSLLSWQTILCMVFICIILVFMDVMPGNAKESLKKHACLKHYCLPYYSKSALQNPKRSKLTASIFYIKNLPSMMFPVLAFLVSFFLLLKRHQSIPTKAHYATCS